MLRQERIILQTGRLINEQQWMWPPAKREMTSGKDPFHRFSITGPIKQHGATYKLIFSLHTDINALFKKRKSKLVSHPEIIIFDPVHVYLGKYLRHTSGALQKQETSKQNQNHAITFKLIIPP